MNAPEPSIHRLQQLLAKTTDAALAVSSVEGERLFEQLALRLTQVLEVEAALIAVYVDSLLRRARTRAAVLDGSTLAEFEYDIGHSPCRGMAGRESRYAASGIGAEFAPGTVFRARGFDSYAGRALVDSRGRTLGLVVVMNRAPLADQAVIEAVLQVFAVRAAAELEREQAERALRDSEASYRAIFEASEDAIFIHDWDTGAILDVSPKAVELYGFPRTALQRLRVGDISSNEPPYTEADAMRHVQRARDSAAPLRIEWRARHADGHLMWHEVILKRAEIAGRPHVLAFVRDITERKRTEEALRASEEQYRAIFNASADAMVLWDAELRRVDINPAYEALFGLTREQVMAGIGFEHHSPEYIEQRRELVRRALAGERCQVELDSVRRDGEHLLVEVRTIPIQHRGTPHVLAIVRDITERKRAEQALRASEAQYRAIFEASTDSLQLLDAQHGVVDVNPAYERMYGKPREEVVGKGLAELVPEPFREERRALVSRALAGEVAELQTTGFRPDGSTFELEVRVIPFQHRGQPHVLGIARDITERKRAEQALRDSEEQYRAIFNASADGLFLRDARFRIVDVNPTYLELNGFWREELVGTTRVLTREEDAEDRRSSHARALAGEAVRFETQALRKDGSWFDVEVRGTPLVYRGQPHVLYAARDISERKRAERALRDSEQQYRAIFNASADALVLRDADFRIVDVNATYETMSGMTRSEVLGLDRVIANPPDVAERIRQLHARALAGEPIVLETPFFRRDRTRFEIELRGMPIRHLGAPHVLYIGRDITARREAERQRRSLEVQLLQAQKMEAIGQLTGGIAHDFNNILASILGYVGLASERPATANDARLADYLEQAQQGCRRARDLIQQMLAFGRGQHGERHLLNLAPLVEELLRLLRATLPSSTALISAIDEESPTAKVDPVQFQQVLLNLGINARDAIGGVGRIAVGLRRREAAGLACASCGRALSGVLLELSVRDSGPGVGESLRERIFEPFFSTKAPGRGTGMGLATVHRIVHDHGGHLLLDRDPELGGARFAVLLPAGDASEAMAAAVAPAPADARRAPLAGRVLLVDDEASVLSFMRELLGAWGLEVVATREPQAALARLQQEPNAFDLVLTDQTMPQMSGLDLAHAATALDDHVPVLLYSGYADLIDAAALKRAGVCHLLRKPVEPAELRAAVESCLRRRKAEGQA